MEILTKASSSWQFNVRSVSKTLGCLVLHIFVRRSTCLFMIFMFFTVFHCRHVLLSGNNHGRVTLFVRQADPGVPITRPAPSHIGPQPECGFKPTRSGASVECVLLMAILNNKVAGLFNSGRNYQNQNSDGRLMDWINFPGYVHHFVDGAKKLLASSRSKPSLKSMK